MLCSLTKATWREIFGGRNFRYFLENNAFGMEDLHLLDLETYTWCVVAVYGDTYLLTYPMTARRRERKPSKAKQSRAHPLLLRT